MTVGAVTDAILTLDPITSVYDISLDANGDIATADFFDTSILYSIFGERRANKDEVPDASRRRGSIINEGKAFENGSKLWLFEQARATVTNFNRMEDEIKKSLQWQVDDGHAVAIDGASVINDVARGMLVLKITHSRDKIERRLFDLWSNTGIR